MENIIHQEMRESEEEKWGDFNIKLLKRTDGREILIY